jgi:hypothetical protein
MKIIKEFTKFENSSDEFLTDEEVLDIKDIYVDLVDDLNLTVVDFEHELIKSMNSFFKINKQISIGSKLNSRVFSIHIIVRTIDDKIGKDDKVIFNKIKNGLIPYIKRLRTIGYDVEIEHLHMKMDAWNYITSGLKIIIKK